MKLAVQHSAHTAQDLSALSVLSLIRYSHHNAYLPAQLDYDDYFYEQPTPHSNTTRIARPYLRPYLRASDQCRGAQSRHQASKKKHYSFSWSVLVAWMVLLVGLFAWNNTLAVDLNSEYFNELQINSGLLEKTAIAPPSAQWLGIELDVGGSYRPFEIAYISSPSWQLAFEQLDIGGNNVLANTGIAGVNEFEYTELVTQYGEQFEGWGAKVIHRFDVSENFTTLIHFGAFNWQKESNDRRFGTNSSRSSSGISPYGGVGLQYRLNDQFSVRVNWDHFEIDRSGFNLIGINIHYQFSEF